jgi:hypothetical protein
MPPVAPQGSRGGLIAAVVIFTIWSVAATIFAIYNSVALSKADELAKQSASKNAIYASESAKGSEQALAFMNARTSGQLDSNDNSILGQALYYNDQLAQAIEKNPAATTNPSVVVYDVHQAITDATSKLKGLNLPDDADLVSTINLLANFANTQMMSADISQKAQAGDSDAFVAQLKANSEMIKQQHATIEDLKTKTAAAMDAAQKAQITEAAKFQKAYQDMDTERKGYLAQVAKAEQTMSAKDQQIADVNKKLETAMGKLAGRRPNPEQGMLTQSDGSILSVATSNVVYINIGQGEHVLPGMTFEVYSQRDGVPTTSDGMNQEDMPVGLGSIEVEHVDAGTSQCRVIRQQPAQHIEVGDLIANLVYDRNTKYNFYVYGKFDLQQNNRPSDSDRSKIEALVTRWGGKVEDKIDVDTDFVVMGAEPKVEEFTPDDLQDPFKVKLQQNELAEQKAYNAVLDKASQLHIPIVNQNRFLYFVGYFDNAQR